MKKVIVPLILIIGAVVLSVFITKSKVEGAAEAKFGFEAELNKMKIEFLKNNSTLRPILDVQSRSDLQKYLQEVNTLVNWYFKNPAAKLWERYPERNDPEFVIKEKRKKAGEEGPGQKAAQANLATREESFGFVKAVYDEFKQGSYSAVASDYQGSVRFDIHSLKREGKELRCEFLLWGGIGPIVYNGWKVKYYRQPTPKEQAEFDKEILQAKKKGLPPPIKDPASLSIAEVPSQTKSPLLGFELFGDEYIYDFPPGVQINYFILPPAHPDAETMQVDFLLNARAISGGDQAMVFTFKLPVDQGWKDKAAWENVQTIEATPEYE